VKSWSEIIGFSFDLPFKEQIAFFRKKGYKISPTSWRNVWQEAHARAFTVARVTNMDILTDIRKALDKAMKEGILLDEFKKNLLPTLEKRGWFAPEGKAAIVKMPDGTIRKRLTPWRLHTIYKTNMSAAYHVGRYKQMQEIKVFRPYWQYMTIIRPGAREEHAAMRGKVYHADHPIWDTWYPPNGFNCGCYIKTLSERQVDQRKLEVETKSIEGKPDEGWQYNPGKAGLDEWEPDLGKYPDELREQWT
jgi:SPP1 gp7 family putative phage head morphogenesis protein